VCVYVVTEADWPSYQDQWAGQPGQYLLHELHSTGPQVRPCCWVG